VYGIKLIQPKQIVHCAVRCVSLHVFQIDFYPEMVKVFIGILFAICYFGERLLRARGMHTRFFPKRVDFVDNIKMDFK